MYLDQYSPIKISKALWYYDIHTPQDGIKILWQFFIFIELEPISYTFFNHQGTESESFEIEMSISQPIFAHKKIPKALWDNDIHTLPCVRIQFLLLRSFILLLEDNVRDSRPETCHWKYFNIIVFGEFVYATLPGFWKIFDLYIFEEWTNEGIPKSLSVGPVSETQ